MEFGLDADETCSAAVKTFPLAAVTEDAGLFWGASEALLLFADEQFEQIINANKTDKNRKFFFI
jgi:hypothetical protein